MVILLIHLLRLEMDDDGDEMFFEVIIYKLGRAVVPSSNTFLFQ